MSSTTKALDSYSNIPYLPSNPITWVVCQFFHHHWWPVLTLLVNFSPTWPTVHLGISFMWSLWLWNLHPLAGRRILIYVYSRHRCFRQSPLLTSCPSLLCSQCWNRYVITFQGDPALRLHIKHHNGRYYPQYWWGDLQSNGTLITMVYFRRPGSSPQPPVLSYTPLLSPSPWVSYYLVSFICLIHPSWISKLWTPCWVNRVLCWPLIPLLLPRYLFHRGLSPCRPLPHSITPLASFLRYLISPPTHLTKTTMIFMNSYLPRCPHNLLFLTDSYTAVTAPRGCTIHCYRCFYFISSYRCPSWVGSGWSY